MSNIDAKTYEEKLELYEYALDAYEAGEPIMSDEEYDSLVRELNRENSAGIGSVSKSSAYTTKHSIIMGSLDKVHMIEDRNTGERNYEEVLKKINQHLSKSPGIRYIEMTPKFDGCSFSYEYAKSGKMQVATRGDGDFGVSIKSQFINKKSYNVRFSGIDNILSEFGDSFPGESYDTLIIRGEALMDFDTYNRKWCDKFKNLRVAVSGTLNKEFQYDNEEYSELYDDITYMCYDYRLVNSETKEYREIDWLFRTGEEYELTQALKRIGIQPMSVHCCVYPANTQEEPLTMEYLKRAYDFFEKLREEYDFPLDGIVIKANCAARLKNNTRVRPEDAIAVKFITKKMSSVIKDIEWSVGRNGECYPVAILEPVYQDGKEITRASLHGYSYMVVNKVGVGSRVNIVMNGDIIPGVESVETEGKLVLPEFETYVTTVGLHDIPHLMKHFTDEELSRHRFINSATALGIDGIKEKTAAAIYDELKIPNLDNIVYLMSSIGYKAIESNLKPGKSRDNIINALKKYRANIELSDIIRSICFPGVGKRHSKTVADYILGINGVDESTLKSFQVTAPFIDQDGKCYQKIIEVAVNTGFYVEYERQKYADMQESVNESDVEIIPVILTGDPSKCTEYKTKKEWLNTHPQYKETTKWGECRILFTNDIESKTGKMAKAVKNGVEIRLYES